jgi:glucokinase
MFLGIEIGGTKLQLGVGRGEKAEFEAFVRRDVNPSDGAQGILNQIHESGTELSQQFDLQNVGIGFGGPIDGVNGRVTTSHQIDGWTDFPFVDWVRKHLRLPAVLGNDCDCAALAEAKYGAGTGHRTVYYITVGTGVGGGLVVDGRVHGTDRPAAAEVGHLRPGLLAEDSHATVESISSGWGISATARACLKDDAERIQDRLLPNGRPQLSGEDQEELLSRCGQDPDALTTLMIGQAAANGNVGARAIIRTSTDVLGWGIAQVMAIVDPDIVVVGGGVSLMGEELFYGPLRESVQQYLFPPIGDSWQVVAPALDEEVVVHGAVALAASRDSVLR